MPFRVFAPDGSPIGDVESVDEVIELAKQSPPGRYQVDQFSTDIAFGDQMSRSWGSVTRSKKGQDRLARPSVDRLTTGRIRPPSLGPN